MATYAQPPVPPMRLTWDATTGVVAPAGPVLTRRTSDLEGLFAREDLRRAAAAGQDPVVYTVASSLVPESGAELPQSITTIMPGTVGGELHMTKGHQHPGVQGEVYLGLAGSGGLLMFDGRETSWVDMAPGVLGYIPPGWAHRSVNTGAQPYVFLAVYPGSAGHDYGWVVEYGMGRRAFAADGGHVLRPYDATSADGGVAPVSAPALGQG